MSKCKRCGSYAINHHKHGRDGSDDELCDVCYWRKRAETLVYAATTASLALNDWTHTYAPEFYTPESVKESQKRIAVSGALAYVADVQKEIRAAVKGILS